MRVQKAGQYGGLLHNFLAVLIYRLADLAKSQLAVAFVISEQEPRWKQRGIKEATMPRADTVDCN